MKKKDYIDSNSDLVDVQNNSKFVVIPIQKFNEMGNLLQERMRAYQSKIYQKMDDSERDIIDSNYGGISNIISFNSFRLFPFETDPLVVEYNLSKDFTSLTDTVFKWMCSFYSKFNISQYDVDHLLLNINVIDEFGLVIVKRSKNVDSVSCSQIQSKQER